jgi:hypothetical protein
MFMIRRVKVHQGELPVMVIDIEEYTFEKSHLHKQMTQQGEVRGNFFQHISTATTSGVEAERYIFLRTTIVQRRAAFPM